MLAIRKKFHFGLPGKSAQALHFLHIRKTGGTAVTTALQPFTEAGPYRIIFHGHDTHLADVPRGQRIIFFLRDPLSRFVSGFYSRLRQGQPRFFNAWSPGEKIAFERFQTPNQLAAALSSDVPEERAAAEHAMGAIRHARKVCQHRFGCQETFMSRIKDVFFIGFRRAFPPILTS